MLDPMIQFDEWYQNAIEEMNDQASIMALATVTTDGYPTVRQVILKKVRQGKLAFFTSYCSQKAQHLEHLPQVAVVFYWHKLHRQVRITGTAKKMSSRESDELFASRPKLSQISASISRQSETLASYEELHKAFFTAQKTYQETKIHRPDHCGGYWIDPESIEFWQGDAHRLHHRQRFQKTKAGWEGRLLQP